MRCKAASLKSRYTMIIPLSELPPDTLRAIVEAYINREGTDYGEHEWALEDKCEHVIGQLKDGRVLLVYDEESESVNLLTREEYAQLPGQG